MGRKWGNYTKIVLSLLFAWGKERGYCKDNPASGVRALKPPKDTPQANRPWIDSEREIVLAALPEHMKLPITLMMFCGLDPQDALKLPKNAIVEGRIDVRRGKTKVPVWMPLPQPVIEAICAASLDNTNSVIICVNSKGRPWTVSGFHSSWRKCRLSLEKSGHVQSGLTLKGLRHTVATILAEMGMDERTIADVLGQKTIEMARHYSTRADKSRKMKSVIKSFEHELSNRRSKIVKLL